MISVGEKIRLPDDVTIGYMIEHILSKRMTVIDQFHSHLESMSMLPNATLATQVRILLNVFALQFSTALLPVPLSL